MITPSEFRRLANHLRDDLEKEIDSRLRAHAAISGGDTIRFAVHLFNRRLSALDFEAVLQHYKDSGWRCSYVSDPRDGDYLEFEL